MSNHTPGPWIYDAGNIYAACQLNDNGLTMEEPILEMGAGRPENYKGNGALAVAAPDLLAALKEVVAIADRATDAFDRAKAAIALAEGATK